VVAVVVDEVEDLVVGEHRQPLALRQPRAQPDRQLLRPAPGVAGAAVQRDHRASERRESRHQLADLGRRHRLPHARRRVAQGGVQVGDQPGALVLRQRVGVEPDRRVQPQQHRHRERALVALDLVEVARRDAGQPGQRRLRQPALLACPPHLRADEHLHSQCSQAVASALATLH
jgi:hypothetical protein